MVHAPSLGKARGGITSKYRFGFAVQFTLIDRIVELEENRRLVAVKGLSLAEDYLEYHFPRFPVMPGVLMLEALSQASMWLILKSTDFARPLVTLEEARNIKYAGFVSPGGVLRVQVELGNRSEDGRTTVRARGTVDDAVVVSGRLVMRERSLADESPDGAVLDARMRSSLRDRFELLYRPAPVGSSTA